MGVSSPNRIVWEYFRLLREAVHRARNAEDDDKRRRETVLSIFVAVAVVETFLNIYFRIMVEGKAYSAYKALIQKDLEYPYASLDRKIKTWPSKVLCKNLDVTTGIGKDIVLLKEKRNKLMHFTSSHETVKVGNIILKGTANTDVFDKLTADDATHALDVAERFVAEIFILKGERPENVSHGLHSWTGKLPI